MKRQILIVASLLALACASTSDVPPPAAETEDARKLIDEWKPQIPTEGDQPDWIMLKSGEWLQGKLEYLRDGSLSFDSEELDTLTFDWDKIKEVRSSRVKTVTLDNHVTATGPLIVQGDTVAVGGEAPKTFPRAEILSILPGLPRESDYWSGKLSLGVSVRSGNTNQTDMNAIFNLWRRSPVVRFGLDYVGNYSELEGEQNTNNHRATARIDYFLDRDFYLTPLNFTAYRDPFQNIDIQLTPAAGAGYHVVKTGDVTWDADLGVGYQYTRYDSVLEGDAATDSTAALLAGTHLDVDVTEKLELKFDYSIQLGLPDLADFTSHLLFTISFDVLADFDLDVTFAWDRVNEPREASDGTTPEPDDFRLSVGIGWDF